MKDLKIEMKDDYSQYLFYFVKQYDNPNNPIDYLKIQNLFDILENRNMWRICSNYNKFYKSIIKLY